MAKNKVAIVGMGDKGSAVYRILRGMNNVRVVGVADINMTSPGMVLARRDKVFVTDNVDELVTMPDINTIIHATGNSEVLAGVYKLRRDGITVLEARSGNLLMDILQAKEELLEVNKLKGQLSAILNSVQEAIEMADNTGLIKYVNPAFTRVTGIAEHARVGKNIFEVSPHGALANSLVKQKPVIGYRSKVGGSGVEVISNASPILVDGEIVGGVVVFQPITDILKLMDELQKSTTIIENLYAKIDQITGSKFTFDDLIGTSKIFQSTVEMAKKSARSDSPVLLTGETGTGKELFAHAIHQPASVAANRSLRSAAPLSRRVA
jgi:PAS domain S-box-containing protein